MATTCASALAQSQPTVGQWTGSVDIDFRYQTWSSSGGNPLMPPGLGQNGGTGWQLYTPIGLRVVGRPSDDFKVEWMLRGGWITGQQSSPGANFSFQIATDSTLSSTVTYYGANGIQPFASLALSLPTGSSIINGTSAPSKMDAQLVPVPVFGEGLNIAPTLGFNVPITESLITTLSAGYTYRGVYDRSGAFIPPSEVPLITAAPGLLAFVQHLGGVPPAGPNGISHYDPGDVLTVNGAVGYRGERGQIQISVAYSTEMITQVNGVDYYRGGDRLIVSAKGGYAWTDNLASRLSASFAHTTRDSVLMQDVINHFALGREPFNSNGDIFRVAFDTSYSQGQLTIGPTASFLYRKANAYAPGTSDFVPARHGFTAGLSAQYAVTPQGTISVRVEHMWVNEDDKPDFPTVFGQTIIGSGIPAVMTNGWLASIGGTLRF